MYIYNTSQDTCLDKHTPTSTHSPSRTMLDKQPIGQSIIKARGDRSRLANSIIIYKHFSATANCARLYIKKHIAYPVLCIYMQKSLSSIFRPAYVCVMHAMRASIVASRSRQRIRRNHSSIHAYVVVILFLYYNKKNKFCGNIRKRKHSRGRAVLFRDRNTTWLYIHTYMYIVKPQNSAPPTGAQYNKKPRSHILASAALTKPRMRVHTLNAVTTHCADDDVGDSAFSTIYICMVPVQRDRNLHHAITWKGDCLR